MGIKRYLLNTPAAILFVAICLISCSNSDQEIKELEEYQGPIQEAINIEILHSDSALVIVKLTAPLQLFFASGDQEYPKGVYIEFYDRKTGELTTTLQGNSGYFYQKDNLYRVNGDVRIHSLSKNQKLNTEELFWSPKEERIYSERFVTIETEGEIIKGEGLTSNQDFTSYRINNPTGRITIED